MTDGGQDERQDLRSALAAYVRAVHESWAVTVEGAGAEVDELPLGGEPFSVAVAAAGDLHLLATRDELPPVAPHERPVHDGVGGLTWTVRFLDGTVVEGLAGGAAWDSTEGSPDVRDLLGVDRVLYHLTVALDGSLSGHHALHAGSGLARSHLAAVARTAEDDGGAR